jgi:hypothetical protein
MRGILRGGVGVQHLLHPRHELGVGLGRDDSVLQLVVGLAVFLSVRRTVS